jgi:hypothetical protein
MMVRARDEELSEEVIIGLIEHPKEEAIVP